MDDVRFEIRDDKVFRITSLPQYGDNAAMCEVVMDKETFIACYNQWIKGDRDGD